ncbi:4-(cytidine 5'-diphospho)-2-C-methyl-D-erythritol kinase, partial [Bordetella hinzii L60]
MVSSSAPTSCRAWRP